MSCHYQAGIIPNLNRPRVHYEEFSEWLREFSEAGFSMEASKELGCVTV